MAAVWKTTLWSVIEVWTSEFGADKRIKKEEQHDAAIAAML